MGCSQSNSDRAHAATVGFQRLQTIAAMQAAAAQREAADAQMKAAADSSKPAQAAGDAAKAAQDTATYTKATARWMMWSIIVLAVASVINVALDVMKHDQLQLALSEKVPSAQQPPSATIPRAATPQ